MKKRVTCWLIGALLIPAALQAQTWEWQNPLPDGNALNGFAFLDSLTGWVVGGYGTILHTTDGGVNWNRLSVPSTAYLEAATFADANRGWAVGFDALPARGVILRTTNGGATWTTRSWTNQWWSDVVRSDSQNVWVCGFETILQYIYGDMLAMTFADPQNGWAVGYDYAGSRSLIVHTGDGGAHWDDQAPMLDSYLWDVAFVNADTGFAISQDSLLLWTTDGGALWNVTSLGPYSYPGCICFANPSEGWIGCGNGTVLHTTNGGTSWSTLTSGSSSWPQDIWFWSSTNGCFCGGGGCLNRTTDGGQTWSSRTSGFDRWLEGLAFVDASRGWAVGPPWTVLRTADGGRHWMESAIGVQWSLADVRFVDDRHGWAVGAHSTVIHTSDGGETWTTQTSNAEPLLYSLAFADTLCGWAVGESGTILHTTNGGTDWVVQETGLDVDLQDVEVLDCQTAWAVGHDYLPPYGGYLLHTTDGGNEWNFQHTQEYAYWQAVDFVDGQRGYMVGADAQTGQAAIWSTNNGGDHWSCIRAGLNCVLLDVQFIADTGITVGTWGVIMRTTDGGVSWTRDTSNTNNDLLALAMTEDGQAWAVGTYATILHVSGPTGEIRDVSPQLPVTYSMRAFPNPFNPRTTIALEMPVAGRVRVDVFDIVGRLSATLTDGRLDPGRHTLTFDAAGLPSGVYFARMQAGTVMQTRKLILLK
jgi:photosystem II stability/assembly factor-like uncharacterized protein